MGRRATALLVVAVLAVVGCQSRGRQKAAIVHRPASRPAARADPHELAAERTGDALLARLPVAPGWAQVSSPPTAALSHEAETLGGSVDHVRFGTVSGSSGAVDQWLATHPPAGATAMDGWVGSPPSWGPVSVYYSDATWPSDTLVEATTEATGGSRVGIRIDVEVTWVPVRSPVEEASSTTSKVVIMASAPSPDTSRAVPHAVRHVITDRTTIHRLVEVFDALPVETPGTFDMCSLGPGPGVDLTFWAPHRLPVVVDSGCPLTVTVGGTKEPPIEAGELVQEEAAALHTTMAGIGQ